MDNISHIDHIAIAVNSIAEVRDFYEKSLAVKISEIVDMPERGIRTAFIHLGPSSIELIEPLHDRSEISSFLAKRGPGLHHVALRTTNITELESKLSRDGHRLSYSQAQAGAHNSLVNFVHPQSSGGVLIEIVKR
jgi:methylmalonyl-CoA/ethylmalonyl-CoA epimerase